MNRSGMGVPKSVSGTSMPTRVFHSSVTNQQNHHLTKCTCAVACHSRPEVRMVHTSGNHSFPFEIQEEAEKKTEIKRARQISVSFLLFRQLLRTSGKAHWIEWLKRPPEGSPVNNQGPPQKPGAHDLSRITTRSTLESMGINCWATAFTHFPESPDA